MAWGGDNAKLWAGASVVQPPPTSIVLAQYDSRLWSGSYAPNDNFNSDPLPNLGVLPGLDLDVAYHSHTSAGLVGAATGATWDDLGGSPCNEQPLTIVMAFGSKGQGGFGMASGPLSIIGLFFGSFGAIEITWGPNLWGRAEFDLGVVDLSNSLVVVTVSGVRPDNTVEVLSVEFVDHAQSGRSWSRQDLTGFSPEAGWSTDVSSTPGDCSTLAPLGPWEVSLTGHEWFIGVTDVDGNETFGDRPVPGERWNQVFGSVVIRGHLTYGEMESWLDHFFGNDYVPWHSDVRGSGPYTLFANGYVYQLFPVDATCVPDPDHPDNLSNQHVEFLVVGSGGCGGWSGLNDQWGGGGGGEVLLGTVPFGLASVDVRVGRPSNRNVIGGDRVTGLLGQGDHSWFGATVVASGGMPADGVNGGASAGGAGGAGNGSTTGGGGGGANGAGGSAVGDVPGDGGPGVLVDLAEWPWQTVWWLTYPHSRPNPSIPLGEGGAGGGEGPTASSVDDVQGSTQGGGATGSSTDGAYPHSGGGGVGRAANYVGYEGAAGLVATRYPSIHPQP